MSDPQHAVVLGSGLVGAVMAIDIAADPEFRVTIADSRPAALENAKTRANRAGVTVETIEADLADVDTLKKTIADADVVLGALSSVIGFQTLRAVIEAGKPFADICFMAEDAWDLDDLARERGVTAVVDMGVAPGMSNVLAGYASRRLDPCANIEIYVGGLPLERRWPFEYKAAFSPYDVIEEYTRPARIVEHGAVVVREALSEPELMDLPHVGTVEAFNTDGLRSLTETLDVPFMKEKTLRYPGHIELMRVFRETGLFSHEPIRVGGAAVRPIDVISTLMFPKWTYEPDEADLTVMRVLADGQLDGAKVRLQWDLYDVFDHEANATSMARTTAFPCAIVARMLARGEFDTPGVIVPEKLGQTPGVTEHLLKELETRGVMYEHQVRAHV